MFINLAPQQAETVTVKFEGRDLVVRKGLTLAAALLEAGIGNFRTTPVTGLPRAPFCMMGVCFDCLVIVNGVANQQSCLTEVRDGMSVHRQSGNADILAENSFDQEAMI